MRMFKEVNEKFDANTDRKNQPQKPQQADPILARFANPEKLGNESVLARFK